MVINATDCLWSRLGPRLPHLDGVFIIIVVIMGSGVSNSLPRGLGLEAMHGSRGHCEALDVSVQDDV